MKPTSEILKRIRENSSKHSQEIFTRLYRYLLREDTYFIAYQNLYTNRGAGTKGTDNDTADGFSLDYIHKIITELKELKYEPRPVRRTYIEKRNGKMRPLGIPSFKDKLIQEIIRSILEAIYEPLFSSHSHGFRPQRSYHTALKEISYSFRGIKWFIEGDIKGCFDSIEHNILLSILSSKIRDIFNLEDDFPKFNKDKKALESLKSVYVDFMLRLEKAVDDGLISAYYRRTILDMSKKVLENLAAKYKNVRKGVSDIMGGQVLEHEGKTIYNAGIKEGEERGRREEKFDTARRLRQAGISDAQIQQFTNISFEDLSLL